MTEIQRAASMHGRPHRVATGPAVILSLCPPDAIDSAASGSPSEAPQIDSICRISAHPFRTHQGTALMAKPELGTKRICPETGRKFYDLNKEPMISPYTGKVVPVDAARPARGRSRRPPPAPRRRSRRSPCPSPPRPNSSRSKRPTLRPQAREEAGRGPGGRDRGRRGRDRRDPRRRRLHRGAGGRRRRRDRHHRRRYRERGGRLTGDRGRRSDMSRSNAVPVLKSDSDPLTSIVRHLIGAIAQLGERLNGIQEVGGSTPPGSTSFRSLRELRLGKPAEIVIA